MDLTQQTEPKYQHKTVHMHKHNNEDANLLRRETVSLGKQFATSQKVHGVFIFMVKQSQAHCLPMNIN